MLESDLPVLLLPRTQSEWMAEVRVALDDDVEPALTGVNGALLPDALVFRVQLQAAASAANSNDGLAQHFAQAWHFGASALDDLV